MHKISKTGSYDDLLNKPTLPTGNSNIHYSATEPASWTITDLWCELGDVVVPQI
ncbi:MAG: hypothetical protein PHU62_06865 [Bacteroidales bacterium]|nr:hypothetical protein [Bacteroidales bacterium]MDD2205479.1 hypothetical protein [Bacteroidales bacterium]MDD3914446.1 hypothetical protein [Bacteroidales bacterium]MDD4634274.1 hypothetical protein [Bacteroidales bacterium]